MDVLRDRALSSTSDLMARIDEDDRYIRGFLSSTTYHPKIQLRRLYLMEPCVDAENLIPGTEDATLPPDMATLNSSQQAAVLSSIKHGISCIWGPPGTGKSHTLANLVSRRPSSKVLFRPRLHLNLLPVVLDLPFILDLTLISTYRSCPTFQCSFPTHPFLPRLKALSDAVLDESTMLIF